MLLHVDTVILENSSENIDEAKISGNGCSTVLCNKDDVCPI